MHNSFDQSINSKRNILSAYDLSRYFGDIPALKGVTFDIERGEVLGVVGQRGSGKSTLIEILSGACKPTSGEIFFAGEQVSLNSPASAQRLGIETIYQNSQLDDNLNVVRNVFTGREIYVLKTLQIWPNNKEMVRAAQDIFTYFDVPPEIIFEHIYNLTNEQKQIVTIARALCKPARLYLMDDPLAALSYERQQLLINKIKELAARNCSIIVSSDNLKHIFSMTDRILVLYEGQEVALRRTSQTTPNKIVELIVGSHNQDQVTPVIWAFERYHAAQQQAKELRRSQMELRQNLEEQDSLNRQLVERLSEQVEALDHLNIALQQANRRLMTEREGERKALARDLHDQVIQDLISYSYHLEGIENELESDNQRQDLAKVRAGIRQVVSGLRNVCSDLRPPALDSQGLTGAINSLVHEWSEQSGIRVQLEVDPQLGRLTEPIELSVFRIIQEGLSNVRKHAKASEVRLALQRTPTASLSVILSDNGCGSMKPINLEVFSREKHFGLVGISERVSLLGGKMKVYSPSEAGLELVIEIPLLLQWKVYYFYKEAGHM